MGGGHQRGLRIVAGPMNMEYARSQYERLDSKGEHEQQHMNHKFDNIINVIYYYLDFVPFGFCPFWQCKMPRMFVRKREVLRTDWP